MVSVAVCAAVPLMVTDDGIEQVAGSVAPLGLLTAQLRVTVPVNPLVGVTVIAAVLPVVAPAVKLRLLAAGRVNEGTPIATVTLVVCVMVPETPVTAKVYVPAVVEEDVAIVSVAVAATVPSILTDGVTVQVGRVAPLGGLFGAQVKATEPVNPPDERTEIAEVLPVAAPATMLMLPLLLRVKLPSLAVAPLTTAVTVRV